MIGSNKLDKMCLKPKSWKESERYSWQNTKKNKYKKTLKPITTDEEIMDCMRLHLTNVRFVEDQTHLYATVHTDNSHAVAVYFHKGIERIYFAPRLGVVVPHTEKVEPFIQAQTIEGNFLWSDSYEMIDKRNKAAIEVRLKRMTKQIKDVLVEYSKTLIEQDFKNERT